MVLGPDKISRTTKLPDLSSFMDGFGPLGINVVKTADLDSSMDARGQKSNKTSDLSSFIDNFGPNKINFIKTADLGSYMDYFSLERKLKEIVR